MPTRSTASSSATSSQSSQDSMRPSSILLRSRRWMRAGWSGASGRYGRLRARRARRHDFVRRPLPALYLVPALIADG